jgi:hypothetical protein
MGLRRAGGGAAGGVGRVGPLRRRWPRTSSCDGTGRPIPSGLRNGIELQSHGRRRIPLWTRRAGRLGTVDPRRADCWIDPRLALRLRSLEAGGGLSGAALRAQSRRGCRPSDSGSVGNRGAAGRVLPAPSRLLGGLLRDDGNHGGTADAVQRHAGIEADREHPGIDPATGLLVDSRDQCDHGRPFQCVFQRPFRRHTRQDPDRCEDRDGGWFPHWLRALLRYLAEWVSAFSLGAGYLFVAFRPDRRALHDLLAGTRVVFTP